MSWKESPAGQPGCSRAPAFSKDRTADSNAGLISEDTGINGSFKTYPIRKSRSFSWRALGSFQEHATESGGSGPPSTSIAAPRSSAVRASGPATANKVEKPGAANIPPGAWPADSRHRVSVCDRKCHNSGRESECCRQGHCQSPEILARRQAPPRVQESMYSGCVCRGVRVLQSGNAPCAGPACDTEALLHYYGYSGERSQAPVDASVPTIPGGRRDESPSAKNR